MDGMRWEFRERNLNRAEQAFELYIRYVIFTLLLLRRFIIKLFFKTNNIIPADILIVP